ncbi:MAG: heme exporter protein CcmB [Spirochaetes bacterium]|nr:heme exporter protein CcmB [Spirochaetota bacterium]
MGREIIRLLLKDIRVELREPNTLLIVASFALSTTIATAIASGGVQIGNFERSLIYWLTTFFSAMMSMSHSFTREEERGTAFFLHLIASSYAVFLSKLIFNTIFFIIIQGIITAAFLFFIEGLVASWKYFLLIAFSGGIALATSSTILSAIAAKSSTRNALFPVIALPILLPILIAAIHATAESFENYKMLFPREIIFFLAFSLALFSISILIFPYIWNSE